MYLAGCRLIHELFMIDTVAGTEGQKNWNGLIKDQLNEECFSFYQGLYAPISMTFHRTCISGLIFVLGIALAAIQTYLA